ncbi:MAG: hypothetical protein ACPHTD_14830 [Gammaproteobacteria bacterium]
MSDRLYFLCGDLASNLVTGMLAGWVCTLVPVSYGGMLLAMLLGMALGMAVALLSAFPLMRYFGAMEVMIPVMLSGMQAGMLVGMASGMMTVPAALALFLGAVAGLGSLAFCTVADRILRQAGNARRGL